MLTDAYGLGSDPQTQGIAQALAPRGNARRRMTMPGSQAPAQAGNPYQDFDRGSQVPPQQQMPQSIGRQWLDHADTTGRTPRGGGIVSPRMVGHLGAPQSAGGGGSDLSDIMPSPQVGFRGGPLDLNGNGDQTRTLPTPGDYYPRGTQPPRAGSLATAPIAVASGGLGAYADSLEGFDSGKLANNEHQTVKYRAGRILSKYPPTIEGLAQAAAEMNSSGLPVSFNGKDKLTFDPSVVDDTGRPVGTVDALRAASLGGEGWQWLVDDGMGGASVAGAETPQLGGMSPAGQNPYAMLDGAALGGTDHSSGVLQYLLEQLGISQALTRRN